MVHEAALSGCFLLLSNRVGARHDFAQNENSIIFNPFLTKAFENAMERVIHLTENEWHNAQMISNKLAKQYSPEIFAQQVQKMLDFA